ncbi:cytochrome P450 [Colletotrichum plurivorum]|uniref:Cytochrome P450 n=1 Tax=Colletotrichum plurivorum TaxID=2175906 RepID=A0A8H6NLU3_9PEZI|nr:cytochrome P450 [Colletotrichum plurivorum]
MTTAIPLPDHFLSGIHQESSIVALFAVILVSRILYVLYDIRYGSLSDIPGPFWYKASGIPLAYVQARGREAEVLPGLHAKYGPVVRVAPNELSYASGADAWEDVYGFRKAGRPPKPFNDPIMYIRNVIQHESITTAGEVDHARQRRILAPAFGDSALRAMQPLLTTWALKMRDTVAAKIIPQHPGGGVGTAMVDMVKIFQFTTFEVMGDLTFGEGLGMLDGGKFTPWVQTMVDGIKLDAWIRIAKHFKIGDVIIEALMNTKRARVQHWEHFNYSKERVDKRLARTDARPDFWSFILRKDADQDGFSMGEQYVNATIFMLGGTETTSTALAGATFLLLTHPESYKMAREEVRSAFSSVEDMTIEKLAGLKYLNACLSETMRVYPPVPCSVLRRTPAEGATICGRHIPADVTVGVHIYATHTSPAHFRDPLAFRPERWLGDPEYAGDHLDASAPFGVGPRNCLGRNLAWHESRLLLATMLLCFDMTLAEESRDWSRQRVYTLWEKPPLMCHVRPARK